MRFSFKLVALMEILHLYLNTSHKGLHSAFVDLVGGSFDFPFEVRQWKWCLIIPQQIPVEKSPISLDWTKFWNVWQDDVFRHKNNFLGSVEIFGRIRIVNGRTIQAKKRLENVLFIQRLKSLLKTLVRIVWAFHCSFDDVNWRALNAWAITCQIMYFFAYLSTSLILNLLSIDLSWRSEKYFWPGNCLESIFMYV